MSEMESLHRLQPPRRRKIDRRTFLKGLGVMAGAVVAAPALRHLSVQRNKMQRVEAGRQALGTWVRAVVLSDDAVAADRAVQRAFEAIALVDAQMSIHRPDSQLAHVNAAAGERAVPVDWAVLDVVEKACAGAQRTGDLYDPTVLPLMRLYGFYDSGNEHYPSDRQIAGTLSCMGHRHVLIDRKAGTLALDKRGVSLDLGSIGKGWALDRAIDAVRAEGVNSALVDVGGNVYALGSPDAEAEGWSIGVVHPITGKVEHTWMVRDMAVATSGNSEQSRVLDHIRVGHLFDARRGRPADGHLSASVVARTGVESDMLSTIAFLLGPDRFDGFPEAVESHFIG